MIPVLEGSHLPYDIVVIQEPWISGHINMTYCPWAIKYHLIYPVMAMQEPAYINKQILLSQWQAPHQTIAMYESTLIQDQLQSIMYIVRHWTQSRLQTGTLQSQGC